MKQLKHTTAVRIAHAVPLCVLPSTLWRLPLVFGGLPALYSWIPLPPPGERLYILSLSVVAETLALLSLGLVRPWGEQLPRWVPLLGGRRVPVLAAVIPAGVGAFLVTSLCLYGGLNSVFHWVGPLEEGNGLSPDALQEAWLYVCYTPLLAWGPLLAVLTVAYYRRRTGTAGRPAGAAVRAA
ncbi:hypothetical protein [Streptomyces sp. NPDC050504]|uniref:hypothetical protein n=1 Tax=Streptomyces sp. NPDC050504 TaxID=3365618 RepID=UPI0037BC6A20